MPSQTRCYRHSENLNRRRCYRQCSSGYQSHHIVQNAAGFRSRPRTALTCFNSEGYNPNNAYTILLCGGSVAPAADALIGQAAIGSGLSNPALLIVILSLSLLCSDTPEGCADRNVPQAIPTPPPQYQDPCGRTMSCQEDPQPDPIFPPGGICTPRPTDQCNHPPEESGSISEEGINTIRSHLDEIVNKLRLRDGISRSQGISCQAGERAMLQRLQSGERTFYDREFYYHETLESGYFECFDVVNQPDSESYNQAFERAHNEALRRRGVTEQALFHPDVVAQYPIVFGRAWICTPIP